MNSQVIYVLLVEDDIDYSALLRRRLMGGLNKNAEQTFIVAQTGLLNEAIEYAGHHMVDVIVLDLNLPDATGLDTLLCIRKAVPHAATIVLTGRDDQVLASKAMTMGAHDYLYKGNFNAEVLVRSIRYAIDRKQSEQALSQAEEKLRNVNGNTHVTANVNVMTNANDHETAARPSTRSKVDGNVEEKSVESNLESPKTKQLSNDIVDDFDTLLARMAAQNSLALSQLATDNPARVHVEKLNQTINLATDLTRRLFNGIRGNSASQ